MSTFKRFITSPRLIIVIAFLIFALVAINPHPFREGVAIRTVLQNSSASLAGMSTPSAKVTPVQREVITLMDNLPIKSVAEYDAFISKLSPGQAFTIETTKGYYRLTAKPKIVEVVTNQTRKVARNVTVERKVNGTLKNVTAELIKEEPIIETYTDGIEDLGLKVYPAPATNLRKGLDLQGGTRVLLQPEQQIEAVDMDSLIDNLQQRLNVFGLSDVVVKKANDLSGNQYVLVEIAGANEEEVKELLAKQGKFEARIANQTVFRGGEDITYVCRTAQCSGIDPNYGCQGSTGSFGCRFQFAISLSPQAAERQAKATSALSVKTGDAGDRYLSEPIILYLDNKEVDSLSIAESLRGRPVTDISITGSGTGTTQQDALQNALTNMKRLQTILITGSLPVKLNIVETSAISPALGDEFLNNAIWMAFLAIVAVAAVIVARYKSLPVGVFIVSCMLSEIFLLLGFAALVGWNLDLPSIAGILISVGTGVDDQIVITDETISGKEEKGGTWAQKLKKAFAIVFAAYATTIASQIPLLFAGAGMLKGFALTTIAGVSFGVFITRPAFASLIGLIVNKD